MAEGDFREPVVAWPLFPLAQGVRPRFFAARKIKKRKTPESTRAGLLTAAERLEDEARHLRRLAGET